MADSILSRICDEQEANQPVASQTHNSLTEKGPTAAAMPHCSTSLVIMGH
jgi:hypothetical protein